MAKIDKKAVAEGEMQVVAFKLRKEEYSFNILNVQEIKGLTDITRVPYASNFIKGVINLRGSVLPVIDLKKRLGLMDTPYTDDTRIIIVKVEDISVGMVVDEVTEVLVFDQSGIEAAKSVDNEIGRFISGIGKRDDRLVIMLDLNAIVGITDELK